MPLFDVIVNAFITLFVTIDPIGVVPIFLAITIGMSKSERRAVAWRGASIAGFILILSALGGKAVLTTLGISIPAFRIAGGLLLFYIAFEMIFEKRQERHEKTSHRAITVDDIANIAAFPLAIPLLAGPGGISATILLSGTLGNTWEGLLVLIGIIILIMLIAAILFSLGERLEKLMGNTGRMVLTRLLGVLLAALSVQFVADGVKALASA